MKHRYAIFASIFALSAVPCFAQQQPDAPAPAEDPAYLENEQSEEQYTVEETQPQPTEERAPASQPAPVDQGAPSEQNAGTESEGVLPDAQISRPQQGGESAEQNPKYLEELDRQPASEAQGRSETAEGQRPSDTQLSFFEISPSMGAISVNDKATFSLGTNLSFRISDTSPLFFEPTAMVSFLSGDNNKNATLFHIDAGLRLDWVISGSPVIPFVKGAVGPTLSSSNDVVVNDDTLSDSYFNAFLGGGLKVLINPRIGARFDTGVTFQGTDPGLYVLGAVALPL